MSSGGLSNYSLCLAAYALSMASSPLADTALNELRMRADYKGNLASHMSALTDFCPLMLLLMLEAAPLLSAIKHVDTSVKCVNFKLQILTLPAKLQLNYSAEFI